MILYDMNHEDARKKWKEDHNYHQRSKVETAFYRFKTHLSGNLSSRKFTN